MTQVRRKSETTNFRPEHRTSPFILLHLSYQKYLVIHHQVPMSYIKTSIVLIHTNTTKNMVSNYTCRYPVTPSPPSSPPLPTLLSVHNPSSPLPSPYLPPSSLSPSSLSNKLHSSSCTERELLRASIHPSWVWWYTMVRGLRELGVKFCATNVSPSSRV